ncbi:hypothetical protein BAE44_0023453 [Dichanthelium oligosanthes]|uniref:DUF674 domain-containing protein n=1 Tax=Dichanthelium oligosanthes TaxID=888268 RepID=A0A1E5URU6_9POAL|nr:hypothetical protein BAE44_0023453 [Dichanthelium oligosanthes]
MAPKISLKLLVETKSKRVLFAEAGKEFVDFVFSLLTLPIGAVANSSPPAPCTAAWGGCTRAWTAWARPTSCPAPTRRTCSSPRFKMYTCSGHRVTVTMEAGAECPRGRQAMSTAMTFVLPSAAPRSAGGAAAGATAVEESGGYVKGMVTYMVTDGLEVTPMSGISSITLINRFGVGKDVDLAENFVTVGMDEGLALLKAALRSDSVLSDVFLGRKK